MPSIKPMNVTAQLMHAARGNPPTVLADTAISNCFPGLEYDLRNVWKHLLVGVELHEAGFGEAGHHVVGVEAGSDAEIAGVEVLARLVSVNGISLEGRITTPTGPTNRTTALEYGNALAEIFALQGQDVSCLFETGQPPQQIVVDLPMRQLFEQGMLSEALAEPGAMTQSLCSPWQADYRECGCFYWAASRPDFVNVDQGGHDWMQNNRDNNPAYQPDRGGRGSADHLSYNDLYQNWERELKFVIGGEDAE